MCPGPAGSLDSPTDGDGGNSPTADGAGQRYFHDAAGDDEVSALLQRLLTFESDKSETILTQDPCMNVAFYELKFPAQLMRMWFSGSATAVLPTCAGRPSVQGRFGRAGCPAPQSAHSACWCKARCCWPTHLLQLSLNVPCSCMPITASAVVLPLERV